MTTIRENDKDLQVTRIKFEVLKNSRRFCGYFANSLKNLAEFVIPCHCSHSCHFSL